MNYLRLLTNNYKEMWKFYSETLELKSRFNEKEGVYEEFETKDAKLSIYDKKFMINEIKEMKETGNVSNDQFVIILAVESVDEVYNKLKSKGIEFIAPPVNRKNWSVKTAHFRDPDGNLIEINQPL